MLVSQPGMMAQQADGHNEELRDDEAQDGLQRLLARQQELDAMELESLYNRYPYH